MFVCPPPRGCLFGDRCRGFRRELPAAQGLRARRHWPSPRASSSAPRRMLLPSPSPLARCQAGDPVEGSDAAQSGRQTASVRVPVAARVARPRAWKRVRRWGSPFGMRRLPWISFSGFSRAVASLLRRTGVDVCRLHAGLPALGWGIPRKRATTRVAPTAEMPAGSLCDAGTDASRSGNSASRASARTLPALHRTSDPMRDAAGGCADAAARRGG